MTSSQVRGCARAGSNRGHARSARSNVSWVRSSASLREATRKLQYP
jgi:hypothetical protein